MTQRYLGGIITANPTEPSENFADSAASGMWTMQEALSFSKAGDWPDPTSINPSKFVENIFSTYIYDGTGSSQTIANGIDLVNKEGLVWTKVRQSNGGAEDHFLVDTVSPSPSNTNYFVKSLTSNSTAGFQEPYEGITGWNANGYDIKGHLSFGGNGYAYVSWTFREQPKFFDIVTYTGDGTTSREVSHNLGTTIGFMLVKRTDAVSNWACIAYNGTNYSCLALNSTAAQLFTNSTSNFTSTMFKPYEVFQQFTDTPVNDRMNVDGASYVAYIFAHNNNDGGFGSTGDQDIIKCGSYTTDSNEDATINLGFEPQWLLVKRSDSSAAGDWRIIDNTRAWEADGDAAYLEPNTSDVEAQAGDGRYYLTSTGFKQDNFGANRTYIYVAIRRGQMKAPTAGTDVLAMYDLDDLSLNTVVSSTAEGGTPFPADLALHRHNLGGNQLITRLTGGIGTEIAGGASSYRGWLNPHDTSAEDTGAYGIYYKMYNNKFTINNNGADGGQSFIFSYQFRRQPKVFDVVTYTGTGSTPTNVSHNLGVTPELIIVKNRSNAESWAVFNSTIGKTKQGFINTNGAFGTEDTADQAGGVWGDHTSSIIQVGTNGRVGTSSQTYVAFLFATLAGVSKVGTYSGTGTSVNVDCGFTSGARFVLAKRTDSTGDWYIWDSVNGIVSGNDPYIILNTTAAPTTNTDYIDPLSSGFTITGNAGSDLNHNGGTYVFLAIA